MTIHPPNRGLVAAVCTAAFAAFTLAGCGSKELTGPLANPRSAEEIRKALLSGEPAAGGDETAAATGTGWATLNGQFLFDGNPPVMPPYNVTKEPEICTERGTPPKQEFLLVDPSSKGIKNVLVYVRSASRVHESAQASGESPVFDQKECRFLSHVFPVIVGETVLIKNSDPTGHNTKIGGKVNFNQTIAADASASLPVKKEEATPLQVTCSIHPWMIAYILPRGNAYFAVTDDNGNFEIPNVPAGEPLEIQVWHEHSASPNGLFVTTPEAKELKWNKQGRFKLTLPEGGKSDLKINVPPSAFKG
jgi:hypothetical protein